jgi:putative oxidoreductase
MTMQSLAGPLGSHHRHCRQRSRRCASPGRARFEPEAADGRGVWRVTAAQILILLVRYGLVVLFFPASALDKILNFAGAVAQAKQVFRSNAVAVTLILVGVLVELVMPMGILSGVADRLAAFVMAGYCAVTAMLFKRFWEPGDFWVAGESKGRDLFWDFLKNFSLASGFLLIVVGLDGHAWHSFVVDPLASSHPYAVAASPR